MQQLEISTELRRNFHIFWDNFPFPVMLVYKDRTIIDSNTAGATMFIPGTRCSDNGKPESHRGCLANQALQEQSAKRIVAYAPDFEMVVDGYWVPLAGEPDIYLHFFADITEYAAEKMFPGAQLEKESGCGSCNCS